MNHVKRAKGAVARVLAPHLHKSDLFELLTDEFARVLRKTEREAHNAAIRDAATYVGYFRDEDLSTEQSVAVTQISTGVLGLEWKGRP